MALDGRVRKADRVKGRGFRRDISQHPETGSREIREAIDPSLALERRLDEGYRRIESARLDGADVEAWEGFWIQLLREYERVADEVQRLAA